MSSSSFLFLFPLRLHLASIVRRMRQALLSLENRNAINITRMRERPVVRLDTWRNTRDYRACNTAHEDEKLYATIFFIFPGEKNALSESTLCK